MSPGTISKRVVTDRLEWVEQMVQSIRTLPLDDREQFFADERNIWSAESCLRRALEALFDLGRHILAKGFAEGAGEYKAIATRLHENGVFSAEDAALLRVLAGYRNRMVHFYHEVTADELFEICSAQLGDVERLANAYRRWLATHPDQFDERL